MAYKKDRTPLSTDRMHLSKTLFLETRISDGKHLIYNQNFWLQVCRYREGQANVHSATVMFYGSVQKPLHLREGDNLVKFRFDLSLPHPQNCAIQIDILP